MNYFKTQQALMIALFVEDYMRQPDVFPDKEIPIEWQVAETVLAEAWAILQGIDPVENWSTFEEAVYKNDLTKLHESVLNGNLFAAAFTLDGFDILCEHYDIEPDVFDLWQDAFACGGDHLTPDLRSIPTADSCDLTVSYSARSINEHDKFITEMLEKFEGVDGTGSGMMLGSNTRDLEFNVPKSQYGKVYDALLNLRKSKPILNLKFSFVQETV